MNWCSCYTNMAMPGHDKCPACAAVDGVDADRVFTILDDAGLCDHTAPFNGRQFVVALTNDHVVVTQPWRRNAWYFRRPGAAKVLARRNISVPGLEVPADEPARAPVEQVGGLLNMNLPSAVLPYGGDDYDD